MTIISPVYYLSLTEQGEESWLVLLWFVWHIDISHLLDKYSKTIKLLISAVWFDTFHVPPFPVDLIDFSKWNVNMSWIKPVPRCSIVAWKIGEKCTWQTECIFVQGWGNTSKCCNSFCQTESKHWCDFHYVPHFISPRNLSIISIHSLCLCMQAKTHGLDYHAPGISCFLWGT